MNRSKQEYNYLYIDVTKDPGQLRISDDKGIKSDFTHMADLFEQTVSKVNRKATSDRDYTDAETFTGADVIKKKLNFYQRPLAKVVALLFIIITGFLINYGLEHGMRGSNWFRLLVILIPGTIYMIYRVFYRKR